MGGKEGRLRVGFAFRREAEGDGHYFCFAEEESGWGVGCLGSVCHLFGKGERKCESRGGRKEEGGGDLPAVR